MKKYIIKKHCEATERCTVALNRIQDYYYGNLANYLSRDFTPDDETVRVYGYASKEDAQNRLEEILNSAKMEETSGYWIITAEIVDQEV